MKRTIYHGSIQTVEKPLYGYESTNKSLDYGKGFYCTEDIEAAKEWASKKNGSGVVSSYSIDDKDLKILNLCDKDKYSILNWVALLIINRTHSESFYEEYDKEIEYLRKFYIDSSKYDVIIGYRADDAYFAFPREFINSNITLEKMEEIYHLGNLGKQYVLISKKAFDCLNFLGDFETDESYQDRYNKNVANATNMFYRILKEERRAKGTRMRDLINNE